jgi:hypothetical protein
MDLLEKFAPKKKKKKTLVLTLGSPPEKGGINPGQCHLQRPVLP